MAIDINGAGTYFLGHSKATIWAQYSQAQKIGAIAQAKRELSRELGRVMVETEAAYQQGDTTRDEYAVYEQAIHLLGKTGKAMTGIGAIPSLKGKAETPVKQNNSKFSDDCLRWLGVRMGVLMVRG